MSDLRAEALRLVSHALATETHADPEDPRLIEHAEALIAIAEAHDADVITDLLVWIRAGKPGKEWTLGEYRRHCERLQQARYELEHPQ